jgi:hypothetical protein
MHRDRKGVGSRWGPILGTIVGMLLAVHVDGAAASDRTARKLAQAVYDRPHGRDVSSRATMVLVDPGHAPRIRQMYVYRRDEGKGRTESLIRFVAPPDIAGTGLLTIDYPGDKTDQWIYLPALDRARRIASSRKGGRFVGSDIFYEDLRDREVSMDHHRLLRKEKYQGVECDVLESVPVNPDNSVYSKRVSWVYPATLIPLRVDFYERGSDKPVKRSTVQRIEKIQGYWTIMDSTMTDLRTGHQTRIKVDAIVYDRSLPAQLFSRKILADPAREIPFRP